MLQLFEAMTIAHASDLHLKVGCPPGLRIDGHLAPLDGVPVLTAADLERLIGEITSQEKLAELKRRGDLEFAHSLQQTSRYRVSLVYQRGTISAVLRRIPTDIPDIDRLGLPSVVKKLATLPRGLVLVTGPTGSGKSTTLAAMIDYLNREGGGHILTMEDPVEYVHRDQRCFITQREIGTDCESFGQALRRALRHDPDVIMIGELRDRETISLALTAAETGHLVLATVHTPGAVQTIDRMLDAFPSDERSDARGRLACSLQGVLSQTLVGRIGGGRIAALEILVITEAIRSCIREGKTHQVASQIQTGSVHGMQTQACGLADLVRRGLVLEDAAIGVANNLEELRNQITNGGSVLRMARPNTPPGLRRSPVAPVEPIAAAEPAPTLAPAAPGFAPAPAAGAPTTHQQLLERLRRS
ncbi:MAG: PilT/PilU family type 4a pilus ATPase [Planctomycetes bacterium]|nr:PilT/PilU family type 4a pilus ATPase [Planctomycetota bacterium]